MKYVPDKTGRFRERPHYLPAELDQECERLVTEFLRDLYGEVRFPVPTDALTKLIERDAQDLDLYADLSSEEGTNVEGITDFIPGAKPIVRISAGLSEADNRSHRLRTTLTHEYGHVRFHDCLYQLEELSGSLFADAFDRRPAQCKRETILDAPFTDWMEWQAGYVCGSILMPVTAVQKLVADYRKQSRIVGSIAERSKDGFALVTFIAEAFDTSQDAARVRLLKLGCLGSNKTPDPLF